MVARHKIVVVFNIIKRKPKDAIHFIQKSSSFFFVHRKNYLAVTFGLKVIIFKLLSKFGMVINFAVCCQYQIAIATKKRLLSRSWVNNSKPFMCHNCLVVAENPAPVRPAVT